MEDFPYPLHEGILSPATEMTIHPDRILIVSLHPPDFANMHGQRQHRRSARSGRRSVLAGDFRLKKSRICGAMGDSRRARNASPG
jgi:hypothetical protein